MLHLACLQLALNDGNGSTTQLQRLQSAIYSWSAVCIFTLSLHFYPLSAYLPSVCILP